jgi:hypothetical protein
MSDDNPTPADNDGGTPPPADPPAPTPPKPADDPLAKLRTEAGKYRTERNAVREELATTQKQLADVLAALGMTPDGKSAPPDPAKLAEQIAAKDAKIRELELTTAVTAAAEQAGAKAARLLDSRSFMSKLAEVDPSDTKAVTAAITAAIKDDPSLKATTGPARSGVDMAGASGGPRQLTEADLARMSPEQIVKAQNDGLLRNLLGG